MNPARSLVLNRWLAFSGLALLILLLLLVPGVVKMIVVAFLLAYIFDPIVTAIEVRGLSRTASTVVFFLFVISIAWILISILTPVVYNQIMTLRSGAGSRQTSEVILRLQAVVRAKLGFIGLGEVNLQEKIEQFSAYLSDTIVDFILHEGLSIILYAVTVPFLVFFFLKDGRECRTGISSLPLTSCTRWTSSWGITSGASSRMPWRSGFWRRSPSGFWG
jgi:predicted PurR-regulated permease PerM